MCIVGEDGNQRHLSACRLNVQWCKKQEVDIAQFLHFQRRPWRCLHFPEEHTHIAAQWDWRPSVPEGAKYSNQVVPTTALACSALPSKYITTSLVQDRFPYRRDAIPRHRIVLLRLQAHHLGSAVVVDGEEVLPAVHHRYTHKNQLLKVGAVEPHACCMPGTYVRLMSD